MDKQQYDKLAEIATRWGRTVLSGATGEDGAKTLLMELNNALDRVMGREIASDLLMTGHGLSEADRSRVLLACIEAVGETFYGNAIEENDGDGANMPIERLSGMAAWLAGNLRAVWPDLSPDKSVLELLRSLESAAILIEMDIEDMVKGDMEWEGGPPSVEFRPLRPIDPSNLDEIDRMPGDFEEEDFH